MPRYPWRAAVLAACWTAACDSIGSQPPEQAPVVIDAEGTQHRMVVRGPYRAFYDRHGRLERIEHDSNADRIRDRVVYYRDGGKTPHLVELDTDLDGNIDRWEEYDPKQQMTRIGTTSKGGVPDRWALLGADGEVARFEYDTNHDARIERAENLVKGHVVRVEVDTDRDGRFDRWQDLSGKRLTAEELDVDGDGTPDHRLRYDAKGRLLAIERLKK